MHNEGIGYTGSMTQSEKSGDYGDAVRGHEQTAAWASQTDLRGDTGRGTADGDNKVALTVGAVLIVALVLLCFRLAYTGSKDSAATGNVAGQGRGAMRPATPFGAAPISAPAQNPVPLPTPRPVTLGFAPPSAPLPEPGRALFASEKERERVAELLLDCRVAFDISGELAPRWSGTVAGVRPRTEIPLLTDKSTGATVVPDIPAAPAAPTAKEWSAIDTQMEAIATSVAFATRPALYPTALQNAAAELGGEMRTYLQTTRMALARTDAGERTTIQARADVHRQNAGQLLARLESAAQSPAKSAVP